MPSRRSTRRKREAEKLESITQSNQLASPLLRLPPEIRNLIYEHLSDMTSYKPGREYNPRWFIERGVKPLRQTCRQLEFEGREYKSAPKVLDLRTDFEQKDLEWLMRTGRLATVTTIELNVADTRSAVFRKFTGAAHEAFVSVFKDDWNTWTFQDGIDALLEKYRAKLYPNLQVAWVHGLPVRVRPGRQGLKYEEALRDWLKQPLLEVVYL